MNVWYFSAIFIGLFARVDPLSLGGDYYATLDKIDNQEDVITREYADWHLYLRRINKKEKVIDGDYTIKKDIVGPKALVTAYILSNNKFYKMAVNELVPTDLCDESINKKFIDPYFEGNSTFASPKDCVIHKGYMRMRPTQRMTFNQLAHKVANQMVYGTYKLVAKILNKDNKVVGGAVWTVTAKRKE